MKKDLDLPMTNLWSTWWVPDRLAFPPFFTDVVFFVYLFTVVIVFDTASAFFLPFPDSEISGWILIRSPCGYLDTSILLPSFRKEGKTKGQKKHWNPDGTSYRDLCCHFEPRMLDYQCLLRVFSVVYLIWFFDEGERERKRKWGILYLM